MTEEYSMTIIRDNGKNTGWREKYRMTIEGYVSKNSYTVTFLPSVMKAPTFGSWICFSPQVQTNLVDPTQRPTFSQWAQSLTAGNP
jgi:aryl carrier-like protein